MGTRSSQRRDLLGNKKQDESFWTTLPGIISACAAVIAAIGGLIGALYAAGIIGRPVPAPSNTPVPPNTPTTVPLSSNFDGTNTQGWAVHGGTLRNPGSDGSGGGANNGFLRAEDTVADGRTSYYVAPSIYHGNWNGYARLRLDLSSSGGEYYSSGHGMKGDIFLANGNMTAQRLLPHRPARNWETFVIPLNDNSGWIFGGGATSLRDVMDNVTDFQIRAEYGVGLDKTELDNIERLR